MRAKPDRPLLDDKDQRIIAAIIRNPNISVEAIHAQVDEPLSTVQKRLAELLRNQFLERMIRVVDWAAVGFPLRYRIDVKTNQRQLAIGQGGPVGEVIKIDSQRKLARYIMHTLPKTYQGVLFVQDVTILFGQPDLSITVRAMTPQAVFEFVTMGLRGLGGVEATQTFHEIWSTADGDL